MRSGDEVGEPSVETFGSRIDGCVGAVDSDARLCEVQQRGLLGVVVGDGLEAGEDNGVCRQMSG